jgi:hypothetical protein
VEQAGYRVDLASYPIRLQWAAGELASPQQREQPFELFSEHEVVSTAPTTNAKAISSRSNIGRFPRIRMAKALCANTVDHPLSSSPSWHTFMSKEFRSWNIDEAHFLPPSVED